jgi:U3 small nucleolar RNA-associated protein 14
LRDEDIQHTEDAMLQMNKVSVEEVAQRRAELRKMRELMFRAEVKAKRIAKIKSKTYRKIKRKEREKLGQKLVGDEDSETEEGRMKKEVNRARERATLRHKTGKWATQMRGREGDEQGRKDIEEMLERGEKLRRRIKGVGSDAESSDEDEDDDDGHVEGSVDKLKQAAFDEVQTIDLENAGGLAEPQRAGKSIFDMKFMKEAMAKQQQSADKIADDFIKELGVSVDGAEDNGADETVAQEMDTASGVVAVRTGGRIVYRPGATVRLHSILY